VSDNQMEQQSSNLFHSETTPLNIQAVVFNRPTLAIFSAGLGEPILFKILGLVYVYVVNMCFKN
jgi:hypothetical protein